MHCTVPGNKLKCSELQIAQISDKFPQTRKDTKNLLDFLKTKNKQMLQ